MLKRFWWLWLILGVGLVIVIVAISFSNKNDQQTSGKDGKSAPGTDDKRIVKTFTPESGTAFKYNSPTLVDDHLYLGTSSKLTFEGDHAAALAVMPDNFFYKMNLDLSPVWEYPLGPTMVASGATLDSQKYIYFLTETFTANPNVETDPKKQDKFSFFLTTLKLVSLTNDGKLRWEKTIGAENERWDHAMFNLAIGTDDTLYFGHEHFYAYDTNGNKKWQYPNNNTKIVGYSNAPIIDKAGDIYFVSPEPTNGSSDIETDVIRAYKFSPSGTIVWNTLLDNKPKLNEGPVKLGDSRADNFLGANRQVQSTPSFGLEEKSLYGSVSCTVNKVDTSTGKLLWSMNPEGATGSFIATPAVDNQDSIYVGTKSNTESTFFAISSDGKMLWRNLIGADLYTSPIIGDDSTVYTGSESLPNGKFHALDIKTGQTKWAIGKDKERKISDFSNGSMLLYKGYVYIGVHSIKDGGKPKEEWTPALYKIKVDADGYQPGAAWPRFHGGNTNTGRKE